MYHLHSFVVSRKASFGEFHNIKVHTSRGHVLDYIAVKMNSFQFALHLQFDVDVSRGELGR